MILAEYYKYIYVILVSILTILTGYNLSSIQKENVRKSTIKGLVLMILLIIFIGMRPVSEVFADMRQYTGTYFTLFGGTEFNFTLLTDNIIYDNYIMYCACHYVDPTFFYTSISLIYFGCIFLSCKKLYPNCPFEAFLVYLAGFSTFSYATNGIKSGAAAAIFLVAFAYRDKVWLSILLALISYGFHHSMQLVVVSYLVVLVFHNPKYFLVIWFISLALAAMKVQLFQGFFADITDDKGAGYLEVAESEEEAEQLENTGFRTGFRLDFIIYSVVPILLGWWLIKRREIESRTYELLWCLYTLANSIWLLCIHANYTNRIAYLSWFLYPFVLIYPFAKFNWNDTSQFTMYRTVVICHLAFTLFMTFVYYA